MPVDYVAWHSVRCPLLSSHLPSMFLHLVKLSFDGQRNFISESSQKVLLAHRLCVSSWGILVHSGPRHATLLPTSIGNGEIAVPKYSTPCVCGLSLSVQDVSCRVSFFSVYADLHGLPLFSRLVIIARPKNLLHGVI